MILTWKFWFFDSFLLAITGQAIHMNKVKEIDTWAMNESTGFVAPNFL